MTNENQAETTENPVKESKAGAAADLFPRPRGHSGSAGGVYVGVLPGRKAPSLYTVADGMYNEVVSVKSPEKASALVDALDIAFRAGKDSVTREV